MLIFCTFILWQLFTLWSWLPMRITMYQPILLYTTEEHGCSLTTFYVRVEQHEPTLLMIKTCNNEVSLFFIKKMLRFYFYLRRSINIYLYSAIRYLVLIVPQDGVNEIWKMIKDKDKPISERVKLSYSACILNEQNILGWVWTLRTMILKFIIQLNCLWRPIPKW